MDYPGVLPSARGRWGPGLAAAMVLAALVACVYGGLPAQAQQPPAIAAKPMVAVVSVPPLRGLVEPIIVAANQGLGDTRLKPAGPQVQSIIPPGESEHGFEMPPSKLEALRGADVVVIVGFGLDRPIEKFLESHPADAARPRVVVRFEDVIPAELKPKAGHAEHEHEHGDECDHAQDPHVWLDPLMADKLVEAVTKAVGESVKGDAARRTRVEKAGEETRARVKAVHDQYASTCGAFTSKTFVVGHDAWGWLARRYGLETVAISGLNAGEPTPSALQAATAAVKDRRLSAVFVEPQLGSRAGRRIAEATGAEVRVLDPLGDGDWFKTMTANLAELNRVLGPKPAAAPAKP